MDSSTERAGENWMLVIEAQNEEIRRMQRKREVWDVLSNDDVASIVWASKREDIATNAVVDVVVAAWKRRFPLSKRGMIAQLLANSCMRSSLSSLRHA